MRLTERWGGQKKSQCTVRLVFWGMSPCAVWALRHKQVLLFASLASL